MKPIANLLTFLALFAAAPHVQAQAQAQANRQPALPSPDRATADAAKHALRYGKRCILKRGSLIAVSERSLRRLFLALQVRDQATVATLAAQNRAGSVILDSIAVPIASHGWSADVVEIHIPGYFGNVFTDRESLDGDVQGYLAAH